MGWEAIAPLKRLDPHESSLMQIADLLIGAITYSNRSLHGSTAKQSLIQRIQKRSNKRLDRSTWLREAKFNLFRWGIQSGGRP